MEKGISDTDNSILSGLVGFYCREESKKDKKKYSNTTNKRKRHKRKGNKSKNNIRQ